MNSVPQCWVKVLVPPDRFFASGSHAGELILWDAIDWNVLAYEHILWEESQPSSQSEIRLGAPKPSEMSIQHLTTNGKVSRAPRRTSRWLLLFLKLWSINKKLTFACFAAGPGGGGQRPVRLRRSDQSSGGLQEVRPRLQRAAHHAAVRHVGGPPASWWCYLLRWNAENGHHGNQLALVVRV